MSTLSGCRNALAGSVSAFSGIGLIAHSVCGMPFHGMRVPCQEVKNTLSRCDNSLQGVGVPFQDMGVSFQDMGMLRQHMGVHFQDVGVPFNGKGVAFQGMGMPFQSVGFSSFRAWECLAGM